MKLSNKLSLSFSSIVLLLILITVLSWNAANNLDRQKEFIANAEDMITAVANAKTSALNAVAQSDPSQLELVEKYITTALQEINTLKSLATFRETITLIGKAEADSQKLIPILDEMGKAFSNIRSIDETITPIAYKVQDELKVLSEKAIKEYHVTGNADDYIKLSQFDLLFLNTRQAISNYVISVSQQTLDNAYARISDLETLLVNLSSDPDLTNAISNTKSYLDMVKPLISTQQRLQNLIDEGNAVVETLSQEGAELSATARENFAATKERVIFQLFTVAGFSIVLGIFLTFFISKNVMKQLGADPQELSNVANRVTNGDYDINDGKKHIGVYNNIIIMVEKMKESLEYSQNILASLPVPTAVFGADNRLQYANREMMNLLEVSKRMEDCIGQTSGEFMYGQPNQTTATLKAINTREAGRLEVDYTTHRGRKLHIDVIAQPLKDRQGNITNIISILQDITQQTEQAKKIANAHANMQNIARELEQVASIASSASEQLSAQIELSENGAQDQAERVSTTATALEEMNATVLEIARNAGTTSDNAASVRAEASAGSESMQECVLAMQDVRNESLKLQKEMGILSDHAQAINEIMNVISDIADQTNLLALNAAIEAARAGEAGRGFAVVADEVRNLAEKTMTSTTDVGNAIASIQKATADNTRLVMGAVEKIERVTEMVSHAGEALQGIVTLADTTADQVRAIATASEEQSATSEEITQSVDGINNIAKETANNMQEAKIAVSEVVNQTQVLSQLIIQLQQN